MKQQKIVLILLVIVLSFFSLLIVFAEHVITPTTANVNEDVSTLYNITVNNTDTNAAANITQVNITIPASFTFIANTNGTSAGAHSFANTSTILSWLNETGLVMNLTAHTFFFNATASTPGTFNISVNTVNASGVFQSNITVTVNDTTRPDVTNLIPINNSQFNVSTAIEIAANVSDNANVSAVLANVTLPNGTINQLTLANTTAVIGNTKWNISFTVPALLGLYNITIIANDTSNNLNTTEKTNFTAVDQINPNVTNLVPVNNSLFNISQTIEISANVTDNLAVGTVLANITLPNGTINQITLSNSSGFASKYNNSFIISSLIGVYNITFIANDTSSNINSSERTNFTAQDLVFPTIQFVSPTESNNSALSRSFILINVTANDSTLVNITIRLFNATFGIVNQTTTASSPNFVNISGLSNGVYYFNATATDSANNQNTTETRTITLDTTKPLVQFVSPTETNNSYLSRNNILANVTATDTNLNQIALYLLNSSLGVVQTNTSATSPLFVNFTGLNDGVYYINASANDSAGNSNITETRTLTIDTTLPVVQFGVGTVANNANLSQNFIFINVTVTETNEANITFKVYNTTGNVNTTTFNTTQRTLNVTGLADGVYTYNVTVVDLANNQNSTETRTVTLDTTKPSPVQFVTPTETAGAYLSRTNILINVTATDTNLANITIRLFNSSFSAINTTTTTSSSNFVNISGLSDGFYTFNATATDSANNQNTTETRNVTIDTTKPLVQFVSPTETSGAFLDRSFILINITANDTNLANITIQLFNTTSLVNQTTTTSSPNFVNISSLSDGFYTFNATATDLANNQNTTETRNVTLDTQNPQIDFGTGTSNDGVNSSSTSIFVNVSVTEGNEANITFRLFNTTGSANQTTFSAGTRSINFTTLANGNYTYNVTVTDLANRRNTTATRSITLDTVSPNITFSCSPTSVSQNDVITCSCSGSDLIDSNITANFTTNPSTSTAGTFSTSCTVTDDASNTNSSSISYTVSATTTNTGGGGGGGGGGTIDSVSYRVTYTITQSQFTSGYTRQLAPRERARVFINEVSHYIGIVSMTSTTANIQVASIVQNATLTIGEAQKFEVTNDTYYDISVTLNSIVNNKANITIKSIYERITAEPIAKEPTPTPTPSPSQPPSETPLANFFKVYAIAILVLALIFIAAAIALLRSKRRIKRHYFLKEFH